MIGNRTVLPAAAVSESASQRGAGSPGGSRRDRAKTIIRIGAGNAAEWYDWNVYAVFAPIFAVQFFSPQDPLSALLATFAVFAIGFVMRPLGGYLFGWLADRRGRRLSMLLSVALAAIGSLLIGLAPTYDSIGLAAAGVLLFARLMQGLAHGGEISASHTYIAEIAPAARRGLWSSTIYVSGMLATLVAVLLGAGLAVLLTDEQLSSWGWRVPFLLGGLLGLIVMYLRRRLDETPAFEAAKVERQQGERPALWRGMWSNRGAMLRVVGLSMGGTVFFYTWLTAPAYAISVKGMDPSTALGASAVAIIIMIIALPAAGALSDRFGRRPSVVVFSLAAAALSFPLNRLIQTEFWRLALAMSTALVVMALIVSILPALLAELFPTDVRAAGMGLAYSLTVAIFGGTAPYLQTWLQADGRGDLFIGYTIVLLLIGAMTIMRTRETKATPLE